MDTSNLEQAWPSKQAFSTYIWIASTWWYYNKHYLKSRNALNLAFFSAGTFFGSIFIRSFLSSSAQV